MTSWSAQDAKKLIIATPIARRLTGPNISSLAPKALQARISPKKTWLAWMSFTRFSISAPAISQPSTELSPKLIIRPTPSNRQRRQSSQGSEKKPISSWKNIVSENSKVLITWCRLRICCEVASNFSRLTASLFANGISRRWRTLGASQILWNYRRISLQVLRLPYY